MSLTNLSKWVPVEGAFGAVASSGPFDSIYNLILNSSLENPTGLQGGNWEFFESKTFETTTAFIVKTHLLLSQLLKTVFRLNLTQF